MLLTDHEYGAMHWCWERVCQRQGLTLKTFALPTMASTSAEIVAAAKAAMTERTRVFFFSHVLSPTGLVLPAQELCAEAKKRGILTIVDGAHAPAFIPLNVDADRRGLLRLQLSQVVAGPHGYRLPLFRSRRERAHSTSPCELGLEAGPGQVR